VTSFVLSGGVGHDFESSTAALLELIGPAEVFTEPSDLARLTSGDWSLLVVNALWWQMTAPKYAPLRAEWARQLDDPARAGSEHHVAAGRPVMAVHTAAICFDDFPRWGEIMGGRWRWGQSSHPPLDDVEPVRVAVRHESGSDLVDGLDDFEVIDEVYGFMDLEPDVEPLLTSERAGVDHPLLWSRSLPSGSRVVYDALGHDRRSLDHPTHREILKRSLEWLSVGQAA
jgi:hypothetical protein